MADNAVLSFRIQRVGFALLLAGFSHFWLPATYRIVVLSGWISVATALLIYASAVAAACFLISAVAGRPIRALLRIAENYKHTITRAAVHLVSIVLVMAVLIFATRFTYYQFERSGEIDMQSIP